jgi:membrane-associated phospholipid phosphatase
MDDRKRVGFRGVIWIAVVALTANTLAPAAASANSEGLETFGDVMQIALPITALGTTFFVGNPEGGRWDRQGTKQLVFSYGSSWVTMMVLKQAYGKLRPNGTSRTSHPSGHTTSAWAGAAFIGSRYGGLWGWLAYGAAAVTGYSRVATDWHFADDVVAGASIAQLFAFAFVTPHYSRLPPPGTPPAPARWRFVYSAAPAYLITNQVTSPADGGTTFDLESFEKIDDPTVTAAASVTRFLDEHNEVIAMILPFESRDEGAFSQPVSFGGEVFPDSTQINSAWRLYDLRAWWRNHLVDSNHWDVFLGAGLMFQDTFTSLETADQSTKATVEDFTVLPYLHGDLGWKFLRKWNVHVRGNGTILSSDDWMIDVDGSLGFDLNPKWAFEAGYRYYDREISTDEIKNAVQYHMPFVSIGHQW